METWTLGVALNVVLSLLLMGVLGYTVLSPRVRDGLVIKLGLVLMLLGLLGTVIQVLDGLTCDDTMQLLHSRTLILAGLLVAAGGFAWRVRQGKRRAGDVFGLPGGNRRETAP